MEDRDKFMFDFKKAKQPKKTNSTTIPAKNCSGGYPIAKYTGYGAPSWQVLYSTWVSYQSTIGANFTRSQNASGAPTNPQTTGPANIFIIRHGEKSSTTPNYCLDNNGIYRACQLINFVNILAEAGTPISYIITINSCPYNSKDPSMRPIQTASMPSFMLNIPMFIYGGAQDYGEVVKNLFNSGIFDGLNVLMVWEHSAIQQLTLNILNEAGALGRIPSNIIDSVIVDKFGRSPLFGDEFFKQASNKKEFCRDGFYKSTLENANVANGDNGYTVYNIDLDREAGTLPACIGPNSQYYPYWNNYNFDKVHWLKSSAPNYTFEFSIFNEPCLTCYSNCNLQIGLYQPLTALCVSSNKYYNEDYCETPNDWTYI
jgi:hypothetical protein